MIFNSNLSPEQEKEIFSFIEKYVKEKEGYHEIIARKFDVSDMLTEDATAKLKLVVGDFVVIPINKLKEMFDEYKDQ